MFVPFWVRQKLICLCEKHAVIGLAYKEIRRWLGVSLRISEAILRGNYEERLMKKGVSRNVDLRKVKKLFKGWGYCDVEQFEEPVSDIMNILSTQRREYWRKRESKLKEELKVV